MDHKANFQSGISPIESNKGVIAFQIGSVENQKGAIAIYFVSIQNIIELQ